MQYVKALITLVLLAVTGAILFVPVVDGADDVRAMFVLLTGIAVRDYFAGEQQAKALDAQKEAYDPTPAPPAVGS